VTADEILAKAQIVRQNLAELAAIPQGSIAEFGADARNLKLLCTSCRQRSRR
jgi:hypothetical protein